MLKDFISAIRGGICGVMGDRHVNNDETRTNSHNNRTRAGHDQVSIWYIDANKLYGYALMQNLPYKGFEYSNVTLDEGETTLQSILKTLDASDYGYWVICDLEYTNERKYRTGNFPLLTLRRQVENNELVYKQRTSSSLKSEKLISDQNDKYEYPIHCRMLKFVFEMGIEVTNFIE